MDESVMARLVLACSRALSQQVSRGKAKAGRHGVQHSAGTCCTHAPAIPQACKVLAHEGGLAGTALPLVTHACPEGHALPERLCGRHAAAAGCGQLLGAWSQPWSGMPYSGCTPCPAIALVPPRIFPASSAAPCTSMAGARPPARITTMPFQQHLMPTGSPWDSRAWEGSSDT